MSCNDTLRTLSIVLVAGGLLACNKAGADDRAGDSISAQRAADMLHDVMEADRTAYTRNVVNRLTKDQQVMIVDGPNGEPAPLRASENWKSEHGSLPLPAQMFRMGAEQVTEKGSGFSYVLLSKWPVNKKNASKTPVEQEGLDFITANSGAKPFYGRETLGGKPYFTAIYADVAVVPACVSCHNDHPDSPRTDFALGDVMGGVVIRIPLD
jgi:hypothetical protein